jgi:hypothetical protein
MNMDPATEWEALSREVSRDRRRGKRVNLRFVIEVSGFNRFGLLFAETTETDNISESGCRFKLKELASCGDVIAIKLLTHRGKEHGAGRAELFQIVWRGKEEGNWVVGALKLRDDKFWEVHFPPRNPPDSSE